ncbi:MAG: transcriptional repressor [Bacteroidales bacterium]|nr:transcriptional repressor [Bacteroidales bacterium]
MDAFTESLANDTIEQILENAGIRSTALRILVMRTLWTQTEGVFTLQDIAEMLPSMDHSTLFRALTLFAEKQLLHHIDDGSGMQKYCVCHCADHQHHQGHVHLTCTRCHQTLCMENVPIPAVPLPQGFIPNEAEYIIKGICSRCQRKES